MKKLEKLKQHLLPGQVYRRKELESWTTSVDRHLQELLEEGVVEKVGAGLYAVPKKSVFGKVPPDDRELVKEFLQDDHFLLTSANDYNTLGVGTTQLYNETRVYNHKRHGHFELGPKTFHFVRKPYFPLQLTHEFLMVDLLNNLNALAEDQQMLLQLVSEQAKKMNVSKLKECAERYGKVATKKFFKALAE